MQANNPKDKDEELEGIIKQMTQWGATEADIEEFKTNNQRELTEIEKDAVIWMENRIIVQIFLGLATQWHIQPMTGQRIGLDKTAVDIEIKNILALDESGEHKHAEVYQSITAMEQAAVAQFRKQEQEKKQ